jgi:hypothetical protein
MKNWTSVASVVSSMQAQGLVGRDLAVALHDFVRDIPFGFTRQFDLATADYTLQCQRGHCTPKSELFVSLLRRAGFADATVVTVSIPGDVLHYLGSGESSPFPSTLQHCFTQVTVEKGGKLCRLDSYVIDPPLFQAARERLKATGRHAGYGIHKEATNEWDGSQDAFCQYVPSTQTSHLEFCINSTNEVVSRTNYLHSGFTRLLRIPIIGWPAGAWLESQSSVFDRLRNRISIE